MRDMSDLASRVPGLPPLPGVVDDLEDLAPDDRPLLLVVGRPRVCNLKSNFIQHFYGYYFKKVSVTILLLHRCRP